MASSQQPLPQLPFSESWSPCHDLHGPTDSVPMLPCAVSTLLQLPPPGTPLPTVPQVFQLCSCPKALPLQGCSSSVSISLTHHSSQSLLKCQPPTRLSLTTLVHCHPPPNPLSIHFLQSPYCYLTCMHPTCLLVPKRSPQLSQKGEHFLVLFTAKFLAHGRAPSTQRCSVNLCEPLWMQSGSQMVECACL